MPVDMDSGHHQPVIPGVPLSAERWPSHLGPPITMTVFDSLDLSSCSQAGFCHCTQRAISDRSELNHRAPATF